MKRVSLAIPPMMQEKGEKCLLLSPTCLPRPRTHKDEERVILLQKMVSVVCNACTRKEEGLRCLSSRIENREQRSHV
jgi:hypothetical protein